MFGGEGARRSKDIARNRGHLDKAPALLNLLRLPIAAKIVEGKRETELSTNFQGTEFTDRLDMKQTRWNLRRFKRLKTVPSILFLLFVFRVHVGSR